ncbi:MAG TPA: hypothetical protein VFE62_29255, partial [Gemmataceae bacterium]|nr:hypothetical protein [Gemmataceae bacterium]
FDEMAQAHPLIEWRNNRLIEPAILWRTQFTQPVIARPTDYYVSVDPRLSLFNKFDPPTVPTHEGVFVIEPAANVQNRVIFVHSWLGNHYYLGDRRRIAFFQQEPDLFAPGHQFNGIGRFLLLRIDKPSPKIYLRVAATRTLVTGRTAWNPRAVIRAASDMPLGAVGNGAFNLIVGPLTPEKFDGISYVALDFAEYPEQLIDYRPGLKKLYHQSVALDYRRLLGWARDISALSETEYGNLHRPRAVGKFPEDLALARDLEFSGAYEDGWLSPHARFVIDGAKKGELIRFRGYVPLIEGQPIGSGVVKFTINGKIVGEASMSRGQFDWLLPVTESEATDVNLEFSAIGTLAGRDRRPVAAKLDYLGLVNPGPVIDSNYDDSHEARLAATGIDHDGWMRGSATLVLPPSDKAIDVFLQFECPVLGHGETTGNLQLQVTGTKIMADTALTPGHRPAVTLHLPASHEMRKIEFHASNEFTLPAPDSRQRAVRLVHLRVAPASTP